VGLGALSGGKRRAATGAVHDGGEALLRIFDQEVILDQGVAVRGRHEVRRKE